MGYAFFDHFLLYKLTNPNRKALLSRSSTAILAFRWTYSGLTPSVFNADHHGMVKFLIRTLGPELQGHPHPHGAPHHQQGQGLILEHHFIEETLF